MVRAAAYIRQFILFQTGEIVSSSTQVEIIERYAAERGIEIVAWFTDDANEQNIVKRPGIQALLHCDRSYELVLCARVWALARSMGALEPFFAELDRRQAGFESAVPAWDLVTQQSRRRSKSLPVLPPVVQLSKYRVAKPVRLNFANLVHHVRPPISSGS